jgi:hypothetical protein
VDAGTCAELIEAAGDTDVVVVQRQNDSVPFPDARDWLRSTAGARQVFDGELGAVFTLGPGARCA